MRPPGFLAASFTESQGAPGAGQVGDQKPARLGPPCWRRSLVTGAQGRKGGELLGTRGTEGALEAAGHACPWSHLGLPGRDLLHPAHTQASVSTPPQP